MVLARSHRRLRGFHRGMNKNLIAGHKDGTAPMRSVLGGENHHPKKVKSFTQKNQKVRDLREIQIPRQLRMLQGCGGWRAPEVIEMTHTPRRCLILVKSLPLLRY